MQRIAVHEVAMPLPDGTTLATDVFVADDGKPHAVLLARTPYGRATLRVQHEPISLARAGWAVVHQDVRGRWGSTGTFDPLFQEGEDGAAAVAWCAKQPWSNGSVAMIGASYNGFTQWSTALKRPPALRAIAPTASTPFVRDTWMREGGAFRIGVWSIWTLAMTAAGSNNGTKASEGRATRDLNRWQELVAKSDFAAIGAGLPAFKKWPNAAAAFFDDVEPGRGLVSLRVPAFHIAGWYDIFCEGSLDAYAQAQRSRHPQRLVVGPWSHATFPFQLVGQVDFGPHANGLQRGLFGQQLKFLRDAVDGRELESGVSVFVMGRNRWLELDSWPPPATDVSLFLGCDGSLSFEPADGKGTDRYRHDPADPVPTRGGRHLLWGLPSAGPIDQRPVEARDDVVVYTSEPLRRELTVIGRVRAQLRVESSSPRTDFTVKLVDVHPDGTAINVVDSIRRVDLTPGKPTKVEVAAGSTAMTFKRGHRIRIEVASANFPHFDCLRKASQTIHWGGRSGSKLLLPVHGKD